MARIERSVDQRTYLLSYPLRLTALLSCVLNRAYRWSADNQTPVLVRYWDRIFLAFVFIESVSRLITFAICKTFPPVFRVATFTISVVSNTPCQLIIFEFVTPVKYRDKRCGRRFHQHINNSTISENPLSSATESVLLQEKVIERYHLQ